MTSFSDKLLWVSPMSQREGGYPRQGVTHNRGIDKSDNTHNKIQNSICFILQATDSEEMDKSTKYLALSIFYRCLRRLVCYGEEQLGLLALCSLRLAAKFNQIQPKCLIFDECRYIEMINTRRTMGQIVQLEIELFSEMGFKIYKKSPYQYLAQFINEFNLSKNMYNTIASYIDFGLTLVELAEYQAKQIFVGTLAAFIRSHHIHEKRIESRIEQIVGENESGQIVGNLIFTKWQEFLEIIEQQ